MLRTALWIATGAAVLLLPAPTLCEQFEITVELKGTGNLHVRRTSTQTYPSPDKPHARPIATAKPNQQLQVLWKARNSSLEDTFPDVMIHFFLVKQEHAGQQQVPELGRDVLHEGALTMDFKPDETASGMFTFTVDEPGSFLLRVETRYLADAHGHDHFAAIDVVIE